MLRVLCVAVLAAAVAVPAAAFSGKGELGVVVARGNSETETANARVELAFEREKWKNESFASLVYSRDSGTTTANRFVLGNQTDYNLDERNYLLGALRYDRDRFSSFLYQGTASLGYGRRLVDSERHQLRAEIGPGVRFAEVRSTGESETDLILRGFVGYRWVISETAELTNRFLVESGDDNTFMENTIGLSVAVNSRISLKTGFAVRHNTEVDPGRKKTDTLTTVNLVYNFNRRR